MNWKNRLTGEIDDSMLAETLQNFKASVDAWSEAAYSRTRTVARPARHSWRLAAGWALACVLALGSAAGALYEQHHKQELARVAAMKSAAQKAAQERVADEQSTAESATAENADLLATVDSDVSREVPAAMEPLAQLMDESGTK